MAQLRSIELRPFTNRPDYFPFRLPFLDSLDRLDFDLPVTFLVGENGSGKSTFLETLACAVGSITVGSEDVRTDPTLKAVRELAGHLKLTWSKKTRKGFFMRAEDFFGFAKKMAQVQMEMQKDLEEVDRTYQGRSELAKSLAKMPYSGEIAAIRKNYGEGIDSRSHGESFLMLFQERFVGEGLYLLDEPEAPLSPARQLSFLALLHQMVMQNGQFIIATHSPILLAYPGAMILSFDGGNIHQENYAGLEHVRLTRDFLNHPDLYLKHLIQDES